MKTKKQLRRELIKAHARIRELEDTLQSKCEALRFLGEFNEKLSNENLDLRDKLKLAEDVAEKLFHVNDVLCAELQDCDRCIDTMRMALDQKNARAELLNRITGPLV